MKLPRDLAGADLVKALGRIGYEVTRQTGSHIRLSCHVPNLDHVTIPNHDPLKVGTLAAIVSEVAAQQRVSRDVLIDRLSG